MSAQLNRRIKDVATKNNAKKYRYSQDKRGFCLELLDIAPWAMSADHWASKLAKRFDTMNAEARQ
jgi:hypothetical protein